MRLVDYETDVEDDNRVWRPSTEKGNNIFQPLRGSILGKSPVIGEPFSSARPRGIQQTITAVSTVVSHGSDLSGETMDPMFGGDERVWKRAPGEVNAVEMNVGGVMRKVMSMEHAMQKEIAHKMKMESLQNQSRDDLQESHRTVQGVGANIRKRQASPANLPYSPPQHARKSCSIQEPPQSTRHYNLSCSPLQPARKPCSQQAPTQYARQSNLSSSPPQHVRQSYSQQATPQHERRSNLSRTPPQHPRQSNLSFSPTQHPTNTNLSCSPPQHPTHSNLSCSPTQHGSQSYTQQVPESQMVVHSSQMVIQSCKICNVVCSGALNLQLHYQGKKHKAKLEELNLQQNGVNMWTAPVECSVCKITCMSEENLRQHLAGKKHATCLQAIRTVSQINSSN